MTTLQYAKLTIRAATAADAPQLAAWWNDGAIMTHAGFPLGLGISAEEVAAELGEGSLIIEEAGRPIGECSFRPTGEKCAEIGIKICESSAQNRGLGKIILSLLIRWLFDSGHEKILLDTNPENLRACRVYEQLGFKKLRTNVDSWTDQAGKLQSSVDYELIEKDFVDFTHIQTPRLTLRPFTMDDLSALHEIFSDPETMANVEPPYTLEKTEGFLRSFCIERGGALACVHRESGKMIGYILFNSLEDGVHEMGWIFNRAYWRRGLAYEACSALIHRAFTELGAHKIFAEAIDGIKSVGLMKKLGLRLEGVQRLQTRDNAGAWRDLYFYGILKDEYNDTRNN